MIPRLEYCALANIPAAKIKTAAKVITIFHLRFTTAHLPYFPYHRIRRKNIVWSSPIILTHLKSGNSAAESLKARRTPGLWISDYFSQSIEAGGVFSHWFDSITPPES